jgi:DNA-binding FrmR family transcriptional regulator
MDHRTEESQKALNLLKTARGHADAIINMINEDRYCVDVSRQIIAVQAILKKANLTILRQHMDTCVKDAVANRNADEKLREIMMILETYVE